MSCADRKTEALAKAMEKIQMQERRVITKKYA